MANLPESKIYRGKQYYLDRIKTTRLSEANQIVKNFRARYYKVHRMKVLDHKTGKATYRFYTRPKR